MKLSRVIRHGRTFGAAGALVAVALSPFVVYSVTRGAAAPLPVAFPADVALIAVKDGRLSEIGLLRHAPVPGIVRFPSDTALVLPRAGTLRASTAYGILVEDGLAEGLANTLGLQVPFFIRGESATVLSLFDGVVESNLGPDFLAARAVYDEGILQAFRGAGTYRLNGITRAFVPNAPAVRAALRDPALRVDPKPVPTLSAKNVKVEVLNRSGLPNAARRVADALRKKSFKIIGTGTATKGKPATTVVYYAKSKAMGALVVKGLGIKGLKAESLPKGVRTTGDVLVLVGRDAFPSPRPTPRKK